MRTETFLISIAFTLLHLLGGCSRKTIVFDHHYYQLPEIPDYSKSEHWAAHPDKRDPADSIPRPFRQQPVLQKNADVFFIHPTTFTGDTAHSWNAGINDSLLNLKTDLSSILYQASAFNAGTRVFAPRYRQAHYRSFFTDDKKNAEAAFELAYQDVERAFEYYLTHYRGDHPLIIAAHSQGTLHAARLIRKYMDGHALSRSLVAAYLIGMPVPLDYFKNIKPCTQPDQTGCMISWRTYKSGYTDPDFVAKEKFRAVVTNPLTWDTTETFIDRSLNKGGILKNFNRLKKKVVSAQVHGNVLWTSKPRFFGNFLLKQKNYHIGDINLFYANIRENVQERIVSWFRNYKPN